MTGLSGLNPEAFSGSEETALIGVSGGRDSVALLHALVERGRTKLVVCYFDHGWRQESEQEAAFVAQLAQEYGLECECGQTRKSSLASADAKGQPDELKAFERGSPETVARKARFRFFAEVAKRRGCSHLYLAHHADDQVETFFFNLLRGAGGAGLCGMHAVSKQVIDGVPLTIHRPLLGAWRTEIDAYIVEHGLRFCDDPSNTETRHTRNRLRHEILPGLEQSLGRSIREPLWRTAEIASAEDELLTMLTPQWPSGSEVPVATLLELPPALQRRALHRWLRASGVPHVHFVDVESIRQLCIQSTPAKVNLSAGWHARRRARHLFLESPAH